MLVEFRVGNHRSLRDEQVLTMEAGKGFDPNDARPRKVKGWRKPLLPVVALYGANASGKSNVLAAIQYMRDMALLSHYFLGPEQPVPRDPFAWGPARQEPSFYEVTFLVDGTRYEYGFEVANEVFTEEWLFAWPKGKKQTWLERDGMKFEFGDFFKGENQTIKDVTRLDLDFHELILEASDNSRLLKLWRSLRGELELWLGQLHRKHQANQLDTRNGTAGAHEEILRCFQNATPEACEQLMRQHVQGWREWLPLSEKQPIE